MNLQDITWDRVLVKPSEQVIQETIRLIPNTGNFWYLLEYWDYFNGSLMRFVAGDEEYRMDPSKTPEVNNLKARTVREYWKYISGRTSSEAIASVSPELKLRIELVDLIIAKWNTKLESILNWQGGTFNQLRASQEHKDIACVAWDGNIPHIAEDGLPQILGMKNFFNETRNVLYSWSIELDKISQFTNQRNQELMNMFYQIPDWQIDLGINVDHPESGKQYRLYPRIDTATLSHFLSNFKNPS